MEKEQGGLSCSLGKTNCALGSRNSVSQISLEKIAIWLSGIKTKELHGKMALVILDVSLKEKI